MQSDEIIFGGSFDPLHLGHLALANYALWAVKAKKVIFVPSGRAALKDTATATAKQRLAMIKLVTDDLPWASLCSYEVDQAIKYSSPSYTINTVLYLKEQGLIGDQPYLLLGDDWAPSFNQWYQKELLANEVKLLLAVRNQSNVQERLLDVPYQRLDNRLFELSSTTIRDAIAHDEPYQFYLDYRIYRYIKEENLYR